MEKQLILAILLLITGLLGMSYLVKPADKFFKVSSTNDLSLEEQFEQFQWKYSKVYNAVGEVDKKFEIFKENVKKIAQRNKVNKHIKLAMNQFGDLTHDEFRSIYLNYQQPKYDNKLYVEERIETNRPNKLNWVGTLVWTGVYNQGICGSCWSFSAIQALEGAYAKQNKKIIQLSAQELNDCVYPEKDPCKGGLMDEAFEWVSGKKHGICAKDDYPYQYDQKKHPCAMDKCKPVLTTIEKVVKVPREDVEQTLNHLSVAPLTAGIDADLYDFQYYSSGIISTCPSNAPNHAVIMVGFDEKEQSITLKNSWGGDWGEHGYFRVKMESGYGPLGVYIDQSYPKYNGEPRSQQNVEHY